MEDIETPNQNERIIEDVSEELRCPLCLDFFEEPLSLNCLHSFCKGCLNSLLESTRKWKIECPLCRVSTFVGRAGTCNLKHNFQLAAIVEKMKSNPNSKTLKCEECYEEEPTEECEECQSLYCSRCSCNIHSKSLYRNHQIKKYPPELSVQENPQIVNNILLDEKEFFLEFSVNKSVCLSLLKNWLNELWFAPSAQNPEIFSIQPLYIPFWIFKVHTSSNWTALAGSRTSFIEPKTIVNPVNIPTTGVYFGNHDNFVQPATDSNEEYWKHLNPTNLNEEFFQPVTERLKKRKIFVEKSISETEAWSKAQKNIEILDHDQIVNRLKKDYKCPVERASTDTSFSNYNCKCIFIPVYEVTYGISYSSYTVFIHGQTSQIYGQRPYSFSKLAVIGAGVSLALFSARN